MNLILDIGNTRIKYAKLKGKKQIAKGYCSDLELEAFLNSLSGQISSLMVSSVKPISEAQKALFKKTSNHVLFLSSTLKMPFQNHYETPQTLGSDRLALAAAAVLLFPSSNVLVIDAGTCVTFDFVSKEGVYLGGAISLGLRMRLKALFTQTGKLPLVTLKEPKDLIGKNTEESILSGVVRGLEKEIDGTIDSYKQRYSQVNIILTGGDLSFFDKKLKNSIFADEDILFKGMHFILEHNTHENN